MKKKFRFTLSTAIGATLAVGALVFTPFSASATTGEDSTTIAGYTEDEFVSAAQAQGVETVVAEQAWGDLDE